MKQGRITLYNLQDEKLDSYCYLSIKERDEIIDRWDKDATKLGLKLCVDLYYQIAIRMERIVPPMTTVKSKPEKKEKTQTVHIFNETKIVKHHPAKYSNDDFVTKYL